MLLQTFCAIRAERQLVDQLEVDFLLRWCAGLGIDEATWDRSSFSRNCGRLLEGEAAAKFLATVLTLPKGGGRC